MTRAGTLASSRWTFQDGSAVRFGQCSWRITTPASLQNPSTPGTPAPVVLNVATGLVILFGGAAPLLEVRLV